jgi:hypothetical protein
MQRKQLFPFALLFAWTLGGCESPETSDQIAKLQEQIGKIAQQLNETKKQVDGLQEANQRSVRSLENLEATIERLTSASPALSAGKATKGGASPIVAKSPEEAQLRVALSSGKSTQKSLIEQDVEASSPRQSHDVLVAAASPPSLPATIGDSLQSEEYQAAARKEINTTVAAVSCSQVWKYLGQGKSPEATARALGVPVVAIHACEQKVGRSGGSR